MRSDLFSGRYLFHLHTSLTDGELEVEDYFDFACEAQVSRLIFLEHIRRKPTYDVAAFVDSVHTLADRLAIPAVVGFEAKVLPEGALDIADEHLALADVVGIAEHSFPDDELLLERAFTQVVEDLQPSLQNLVAVWVHPGLWFVKRRRVPDREPVYTRMMSRAHEAGVCIEHNLRYQLVSPTQWSDSGRERFVIGVDAHNIRNLHGWQRIVATED